MSIFLTGRRSATTTLAQIHAYDLNLCTALHCSRRTLTLAPRSCPATSSTNALMGVGCHQPVRLPRANPHSARGTTACHFPRFRSLKAFGRRPRCTPRRRDRPASETLNKVRPGGFICDESVHSSMSDIGLRWLHGSFGPNRGHFRAYWGILISAVDALPGYKLDSVRNMLKGNEALTPRRLP